MQDTNYSSGPVHLHLLPGDLTPDVSLAVTVNVHQEAAVPHAALADPHLLAEVVVTIHHVRMIVATMIDVTEVIALAARTTGKLPLVLVGNSTDSFKGSRCQGRA